MKFLEHYVVMALIFVVIDSAWIAGVANKFYKAEMGSLLKKKPDLLVGALFYLLYIWGIIVLVLDPALAAHRSYGFLLSRAALLGLVMYATYDLTNLSTLKGWSRKLTVVDMVWGVCITAVVSSIAFALFR
jgi:uncharacterized membrane protein